MNVKRLPLYVSCTLLCISGIYFLAPSSKPMPYAHQKKLKAVEETNEEEETQRSAYIDARVQYEFDILKDPATGTIPSDIIRKEGALARSIPVKQYGGNYSSRIAALNTYQPAGPDNIGGRTRTVAFDKRSNQVILAGSVSGGIFRSANGGTTWTRVTPLNELHNVTAIAQDTRSGFENTWYAGGGEALGNSASGSSAFYLGYGILKSTDNGLNWTRLTLAITDITGLALVTGTIEVFDNAFDLVHKIIVNPANGDVYLCGHRRLVRSQDGGSTFKVVFAGNAASTSDAGQMDIVTTSTGRLFLAVNGGNPDLSKRGLWTSTDGTTWQRFAGGQTLGIDSADGWRGNSYTKTDTTYNAKRIVLALPPSNQNTLYAFYENGLSQKSSNGARPEADLFRFNVANTSPPFTAVNLSANMPDFPGQADGVDPITVQSGYDMVVAVKPDNPNIVYVGGSNLYRSTDGFTTANNTEWIGGYKKGNPPNAETYTNSHPDFHNLVFDPSNASRAIVANDGGLQITSDITAATVSWAMVTNYQTLQYYYVAINPASGQQDFIGGAQDNGCYIRYAQNSNPNAQTKVSSGDGGAVAIGTLTSTVARAYVSSTQGTITRLTESNAPTITPSGLTANPDGGYGDFITYFKLDFDNPEYLYYVNYNRVFRTKNASTVTGSAWEELTGISNTVNAASPRGTNISIRALEVSRGPYIAAHSLYIGASNGKLYRLDDPANAAVGTAPVDITPSGMTGNVSDIAVNPNRDDEILVSVSNYNTPSLWWTNNAKSTAPAWKNAEGNLLLPSVRSCMIVVKKDAANAPLTEYYVGTSIGLYSTTNISATPVSWVREGDNVLNYAVVTSLDYRPQDNTLLAGTHGNGMYFANTGTTNFMPNLPTGISDPVRNDKNFIRAAYPSFTNDRISYTTGNMFNVQKLIITVHTAAGQLAGKTESGYQSGTIDVHTYAAGAYLLTITSSDNRQQFIQRFVKY